MGEFKSRLPPHFSFLIVLKNYKKLRSSQGWMFIDIHTHLDHELFNSDRDAVVQRAKDVGVSIILTNGTNPQTNRAALALAERYLCVKVALGIYPIETVAPSQPFELDSELSFIHAHAKKIVAIGEIGLDYKESTEKEKQQDALRKQLQLAKKLKKPVILHSRNAEEDVLTLLEEERMEKVLLHCFCGKKKLIERAAKQGWFFSIPTSVTRATHFQELIRAIPTSHLFCETDAPYLSPIKEQRNEPAFVLESYKMIAQLKGLELEEVKNLIFNNWQRLFL